MEAGDEVLVENMDGEQSRAAIDSLPDQLAGEATIPKGDEEVSVSRYWGSSVDPDEAVVVVRFVKTVTQTGEPLGFSKKTYTYPESKVSPA